MGDRANCVVKQAYDKNDGEQGEIFLYTHWSGGDLPKLVQKAIKQHRRWDDPPYLTRIIFDTMTNGQHGQETGFGISVRPCDNSYYFVVVDPANQQIRFETEEDREPVATYTFKEYCALKSVDYPD